MAPTTTEIYTLSLHDALPIYLRQLDMQWDIAKRTLQSWEDSVKIAQARLRQGDRSEEHTSELQSRPHLVCRLLLEKKKTKGINSQPTNSAFASHAQRSSRPLE